MFTFNLFKDSVTLIKKINSIMNLLHTILQEEKKMSIALDALTAQVTRTTEVATSAISLIEKLATDIVACSDDKAALEALAASLAASTDALSNTIAINTEAAPEIIPEVTP